MNFFFELHVIHSIKGICNILHQIPFLNMSIHRNSKREHLPVKIDNSLHTKCIEGVNMTVLQISMPKCCV